MINIYQSLLCKKETDYQELISLIKETRIENEYKTIAIKRDRGGKADYVQTYCYDIIRVIDIVNENVVQKKWFVSIYLNWLLYEIDVVKNNLSICFEVFCIFLENNLYRKIIEKNRYECYGFCLSALTLLDKDYLLNFNGVKKYTLLKIAIEGIVTYLYYHKGTNILWDAEMYSNYARLFYRFRDDMTKILLDKELELYGQYSYCYGMYEAFKCAPVECEYKLSYFQNALMMQQNQTVSMVTQDAMDVSLLDAVSNGERHFMGFTTRMLQYTLVEDFETVGLKGYIEELNAKFHERICKQKEFAIIRCLERYFQLEPYELYGYVQQPYKRTTIGFDKLLNNLNIIEESCSRCELEDGSYLYNTGIIDKLPEYNKWHDCGNTEGSRIMNIKAIVRKDLSVRSIYVVGLNLYELYLDISRTGLFFDIPCVVGMWGPKYECSLDCINLLVGTDNDVSHGSNNNK